MNEGIVKARKELFAKRNIEMNLPEYLRGLAGVYYRLAHYNLAMQYTAFEEGIKDGDMVLPEGAAVDVDFLRKIIADMANGTSSVETLEETLNRLESMRNKLTVAMQALTAYTDRLYLHEYVLLRLAPGMEGTVEEIDSQAALEEISSFVFSDEEQDGLLARVALVVSELPVRMTKAKFFEWVQNTMTAYKDADGETLERVFYMLYSAAGLDEPEGMECFPKCKEALAYFRSLDYRTMTEENYFEAKQRIEEITQSISEESDVYFSLMEMVNNLMAVFLTVPYSMPGDLTETKPCCDIYRLLGSGEDDIDVELVEAFEAFEGKPEEIEEFLFREEGYFDEFPVDEKLLEAMMQKNLYESVLLARKLHTTSIFVELEQTKKFEMTLDEAVNAFCEKLASVLESGQRATNRAIMARVIQTLPLPFTKKSDIQKYILASFETCHDMSEKTAAMRVIRDLAEGI